MDERKPPDLTSPDLKPSEFFPDKAPVTTEAHVPFTTKQKILWPLMILLGLLSGFGGYVYYVAQNIPDASLIKKCLVTSMFQVRLCPTDASYVRLDQVADVFLHALVNTEDAAFFYHGGVDLDEMYNTVQEGLDQGGISRGASTITQQLVKNVFLTPEKSIARKIKEVVIAFDLEKVLTKKQILEKYINVVEFGPGLYGIQKASYHYFQKHPSELNLLESAYLVHLLPNPKVYSGTFARGSLTDFSRSRVRDISRKMVLFKRMTEEQYELADSLIDQFPWTNLDYQDNETLRQTLRPVTK